MGDLQYRVYVILGIIAFIFCASTILFVTVRQKNRPHQKTVRALLAFLWLALLYLVNNGFETLTSQHSVTLFLARLDYAFTAFLPVAWLLFVLYFAGYERNAELRSVWPLLIVPTLTTIVALSPLYDGLIWGQHQVVDLGLFNQLKASGYGVWLWVHGLYSFSLYFFGIIVLFVSLSKGLPIYRKRAGIMIAGILLPIVSVLVFLLRLIPGQQKDFSAIGFVIAGIIIVFETHRFSFLDIKPIARGILVENLRDGMIVVDMRGQVVDINPSGRKILQLQDMHFTGRQLSEISPKCQQIFEKHGDADSFQTEIQWDMDGEQRTFDVQVTSLEQPAGRLIVLRDISLYRNAQKALSAHQVELEVRIEERTAQLSALNATLEDRVEKRTHELTALYSVASVGGELLTLEEFLKESVRRTLNMLESSAGLIYLSSQINNFRQKEKAHYDLVMQESSSEDLLTQIHCLILQQDLVTMVMQSEQVEVFSVDASNTLTRQDPQKDYHDAQFPIAFLITPMQVSGKMIGAMVLCRLQASLFSANEVLLVSGIANQIGVGVMKYYYQKEAEKAHVREERQVLAANLHDSVLQTLYGVATFSDAAKRHLEKGDIEEGMALVDRIDEETRSALKEFRLLIYNLRPPELEKTGLVGAIKQRLISVENRTGLKYGFNVIGEMPALQSDAEENLYLIVQEVLNNTMRHAHASQVCVDLKAGNGQFSMRVKDDGCGFDPDQVQAGCMGLANMSERAAALGGHLKISSAPGNGTSLEFTTRLENISAPSVAV
jgi:signal transduction histidine kinase